MSDAGGTKFDSGKPRISLIPVEAILGIGKALTYGAKKYQPDHNFRNGIQQTRIADAAFRHLLAWVNGEDKDPESGLPHLYHAGASIAMLIWMTENRKDLDDRWKPNK